MERVLLGIGAVVLLVLGGVGALLYPPESEANPTIAWKPPSLSLMVGAGQSTAVEATFTPSANASGVTVEVVPELAPYVSVSPSSFASVEKGVNYAVTVTASATSTAPLGLHEGTLHLKQGKKTLAKPLPIGVEVVWPTFLSEELGFALQYPPGWYFASEDEDTVEATAPELPIKFQIFRHVGANPEFLPIEEWADSFFSINGIPAEERESLLVGDRETVRIVVHHMFSVDAVHIYIADNPDVIEINYSLYDAGLVPDYEAIVQTISFTD